MKIAISNRHLPLFLAVAGLFSLATAVNAEIIIGVQSVTYAAGSTGDTLDVTLTNTGPVDVIVGGFSFGLEVGTSDLSFTGVSTGTTTATYIFGADSLFGPDISVQPPNLPGQTLEAEDIDALLGSTVGSGVTVGLGAITFNLSAATPSGPIQLSLIPIDNSLSDPNGDLIAFSTSNGTVTVTGGETPTPEPAASGVVVIALLSLLGAFRRLRPSVS